MSILLFILIGMFAGACSGLLGVGGGIVIVPLLVFLVHFGQKKAAGTSLAVLCIPVGILAVLKYYKAGLMDLRAAGFIALGFVPGALLSSSFIQHIPELVVKRLFGLLLMFVAGQLIWSGGAPWLLGGLATFGLGGLVKRTPKEGDGNGR